jgi:hypothetical protein
MASTRSSCLVRDTVAVAQVGRLRIGKCIPGTVVSVDDQSGVNLDGDKVLLLLQSGKPAIEYVLARSDFNDRFVGDMTIRKKAACESRTLQFVYREKIMWELSGESDVVSFYGRLYPLSFIVCGLSHFDMFFTNKVFAKLEHYENPEHTIDSWGLIYYKEEPKLRLMNGIHESDEIQKEIDYSFLANIEVIRILYQIYRLFITT